MCFLKVANALALLCHTNKVYCVHCIYKYILHKSLNGYPGIFEVGLSELHGSRKYGPYKERLWLIYFLLTSTSKISKYPFNDDLLLLSSLFVITLIIYNYCTLSGYGQRTIRYTQHTVRLMNSVLHIQPAN